MSKHLRRDLERIERGILEIGGMVEQNIATAIAALIGRRPELAKQVLDLDEEIDRREVELEEDCLKTLALHQPVATDLRFIIAVIKVNSTLERMGDLACNIARGALRLADLPEGEHPVDLAHMAGQVRGMVDQSLNALVRLDAETAREVLVYDDEVDAENSAVCDTMKRMLRENTKSVEYAVQTLLAARHLERIADHATNIAEDVVFLVEGDIIRHAEVTE
jgi:phosphate transport system protein